MIKNGDISTMHCKDKAVRSLLAFAKRPKMQKVFDVVDVAAAAIVCCTSWRPAKVIFTIDRNFET